MNIPVQLAPIVIVFAGLAVTGSAASSAESAKPLSSRAAAGRLPAPPDVSFAGNILTIRTARYQIRWQNGSLIAAQNLLAHGSSLTIAQPSMNVEQMPNGLGSFYGHEAQGKIQHHPWGNINAPFAAQHPPDAHTAVRFEKIPGGARLTYSGLKDEPGAALVQELTVDPHGGDLVIHQQGRSPNPGVFGIGFSLLNLRPDIHWIVPYFGGQTWRENDGKGTIMSIAWPEFWNAGLIIGELPGNKGASGQREGVFSVWAEDAAMRPKYLRRFNGEGVQAVGFEACNDWPYDDRREMNAFNWRFNTYGGSWMEPAHAFKEWMVKTRGMVPRRQRPSKWIDDIALIWPTYINDVAMRQMAGVMDPHRILLMDWGWLRDFNRRIPEYKPQDDHFADQVALAHRYGYRVGGYTSEALIDQETNPDLMKATGLEYFFRGLNEDRPAPEKGWLVYVHPGSSKWREFYSDKMREVTQKYGLDYLYQDVVGGATGSSGLIEGKTFSAAVGAVEASIRAKAPLAALGGEFWTEVNAAQEDFGVGTFLVWGDQGHKDWISSPDRPHPILSYLFSEYCIYWPHQIQIRDTELFHQDQNINEVIGAIPVWTTSPDDRVSEAHVTRERARLWAEGFRPYFPAKWQPQTVSYMRDPAGRTIKYVRIEGSTYCYQETGKGDRLRYARVTGRTQVQAGAPANIDGWIAYDTKGPIGLNPAQWYCLFPGSPPPGPIRITALPANTWIKGTRSTDEYCLVEMQGAGKGTIQWNASRSPQFVAAGARRVTGTDRVEVALPTSVLFVFASPASISPGEIFDLTKWQHQIVSDGQIINTLNSPPRREFNLNGQTRQGIVIDPPLGGKGSEYTLDRLMTLPNNPNVALRVGLGRLGGAGDGVNFVVHVNGQEIWRHYSESKQGWEDVTIPLGAFAGRDIVLSLALDCGPSGFNTSNDGSVWSDPYIAVDAASTVK